MGKAGPSNLKKHVYLICRGIFVLEIMADTSFDVSIHFGPGVTSLPQDCKDDNNPEDNSDPNKVEVPCSFGLMFGMFFSVFVVLALTVILILYLFCLLDYQVEEKCYYKEHRMPNYTKTTLKPIF